MRKVCVQKSPANGKKAGNEFGHATETGEDCTDVKVRGQSGTGHEVGVGGEGAAGRRQSKRFGETLR